MNLKCGFLHFKFSIFLNYNELPATHFVHERHNGTASGTLEPVLVPGRSMYSGIGTSDQATPGGLRRAAGPEPGEARGSVAAAPACRAAAVPPGSAHSCKYDLSYACRTQEM